MKRKTFIQLKKNVLGHLVMTLLSCEAEKKGHSNQEPEPEQQAAERRAISSEHRLVVVRLVLKTRLSCERQQQLRVGSVQRHEAISHLFRQELTWRFLFSFVFFSPFNTLFQQPSTTRNQLGVRHLDAKAEYMTFLLGSLTKNGNSFLLKCYKSFIQHCSVVEGQSVI